MNTPEQNIPREPLPSLMLNCFVSLLKKTVWIPVLLATFVALLFLYPFSYKIATQVLPTSSVYAYFSILLALSVVPFSLGAVCLCSVEKLIEYSGDTPLKKSEFIIIVLLALFSFLAAYCLVAPGFHYTEDFSETYQNAAWGTELALAHVLFNTAGMALNLCALVIATTLREDIQSSV